MGKNLIQQARGKGGPGYRSPGFRMAGSISLPPQAVEPVTGKIIDLIKCPGHSAPLALMRYGDKEFFTAAPEGVHVGQQVSTGPGVPVVVGNVLALRDIPEGAEIMNIEHVPGDGGRYCRTSGAFASIVTKTAADAIVLLPSKKQRVFSLNCRALIGVAAGSGRKEKPVLKAGNKHFLKRMKNKRWPNPSGAAQNAVDHPFGNKRTSRKGKRKAVSKHAPPGRKVGSLWPRSRGQVNE